ncbi:Deoxyribodipyrimidine photo-lyase [Sulfidibacter corallicola]|uniref:Deoxyribodipyrimidine photo-lyase n=1 Tax=Sulfidibacter corallicola TaxID=2818388 RepID=A0A8A4TDA6_SULCO|nr:deoxyribodipyrimidine photo-lyase [Sulfidibacter corallicola]QTD47916.1 deoxyribodipyrimidine photo-lyase [Sulfidibacter corallicola]
MVEEVSVSLFWFRRDLRLEDNRGLEAALRGPHPVIPIFIFDRNILDKLEDRRDRRVTFIHRTLSGLKEKLRSWGSDLWVFEGTPIEVFGRLSAAAPERVRVRAVYTNRDYEPYAVRRDAGVAELLTASGATFESFKDQCVFERNQILNQSGSPYTVFTPYKRKWLASLTEADLALCAVQPLRHRFHRVTTSPPLPSLADLGFEASESSFPGTALHRDTLRRYGEERDFPARDITSRLGLHLRFGTLSVRDVARQARDIDPVFLSQIVWRDFFMQILHHFPHVVKGAFRRDYDRIPWRRDEKAFARWCAGNTGVPIVDAGMRELDRTGYMHNRVRMIVASFLCKHLLIDWRWGERHFAQRLLDYDLAANNGNWQWAAGCGCDAAPYFRVFNPWLQAKKFDPDGTYVRRWVPELGSGDYPAPMVDHKLARQRAISVYKAALDGSTPDPRERDSLFD